MRRSVFVLIALHVGLVPLMSAQKQACLAMDMQEQRQTAGFTLRTFLNDDSEDSCFQILRNRRVIHQEINHEGFRYTLGQKAVPEVGVPAIPDGTDLTGSGHPDMIVTLNTRGAHCCLTVMVYELKDVPKRIAKFEVTDTEYPYFERGGNGFYRFHAQDWSLAYWPSSFAGSPSASVILRYTSRGYHLDLDAMRAPMPSEQDVEKARTDAKELFANFGASESGIFWYWVMQWIYSGHDDLAWNFVDEQWPANVPGKEEWTGNFCAMLADSPYWADLQPFVTHAPATCISAAEDELRQVKVIPSGSIKPNLLRTP
ncbi:hypothetical protein [Terriglobus roseus]|uniref:Uncharacterized protein n=1 Tax=Terriglobus roseus TaxID=392734 RepID=A0A1G7PXT8_9BACT|nr:hypothetical protein [Terriglobus roseus]SDF91051.1 hypothetical protein SAMN05444167_3666 [Terriglobus roseus]